MPTVAMSTPASAGPAMRETLTMTLLRPTALNRSDGPTISTTKLWRDGLSTALMMPITPASTQTIQSVSTCMTTMRPRASACKVKAVWVTSISLRLSNLSASRPPTGPSTSTGPNCRATVMPRSRALPPRYQRTSAACAKDCIQVPLCDTV